MVSPQKEARAIADQLAMLPLDVEIETIALLIWDLRQKVAAAEMAVLAQRLDRSRAGMAYQQMLYNESPEGRRARELRIVAEVARRKEDAARRRAEKKQENSQIHQLRLQASARRFAYARAIGNVLISSPILAMHARWSTKAQFAHSPIFDEAILEAVNAAPPSSFDEIAINSSKFVRGIKSILLGPVQLYEALDTRA
jgi:hypothetical protein